MSLCSSAQSVVHKTRAGAHAGQDCRLEKAKTCTITSETDAIPESAPSPSAHRTVTFLVASTTAVCRGAEGRQQTRDFDRSSIVTRQLLGTTLGCNIATALDLDAVDTTKVGNVTVSPIGREGRSQSIGGATSMCSRPKRETDTTRGTLARRRASAVSRARLKTMSAVTRLRSEMRSIHTS